MYFVPLLVLLTYAVVVPLGLACRCFRGGTERKKGKPKSYFSLSSRRMYACSRLPYHGISMSNRTGYMFHTFLFRLGFTRTLVVLALAAWKLT